ncbi:MAG TPA: hypothetical protein VFD36_29590 [Kofleriaceae bacterium]|nr:hypothetical protein [Kofleriaceae bacterium]
MASQVSAGLLAGIVVIASFEVRFVPERPAYDVASVFEIGRPKPRADTTEAIKPATFAIARTSSVKRQTARASVMAKTARSAKARTFTTKRRAQLVAANLCINGPLDQTSPKAAKHGPVVRGGKCQRCLDVHAGKLVSIYEAA